MSTTATWQHAEADAIEVKADVLQALTIAIERTRGMFDDRSEIRDALEVARTLTSVEEENLRRRAALYRGE